MSYFSITLILAFFMLMLVFCCTIYNIGYFRYWIKLKWMPFVLAMLIILGIGLGILSYFADYKLVPWLRIRGFPLILGVFQYENGGWCDYICRYIMPFLVLNFLIGLGIPQTLLFFFIFIHRRVNKDLYKE